MMRRALAMVPLLVLMQSTRPDNYFSCTTFPDYGLHLTFVVHYAPVSGAGAQQVMLLVSDQRTYPCANYQIESGTSVAGQTVRVSMTGNVIKPDVCTSTGPAQYQTTLPLLPGTYSLEFARSGAVDRYRLTVTPAAIEITTIESSFTRPL